MFSNALVSVLMPVFNTEPFLSVALDSILAQTHRNLEIICLDDASTDGSYEILMAYAKRDSRIMVLRNATNQGVVATRNTLLSKATGELIAWIDADDWLSPEKISIQLAFLATRPRVGAVGTGIAYATLSGEIYKEESYSPDPALQRIDPSLCCATVLVRRAAIDDAGFFRALYKNGGEDGDWLLRIADSWDITNLPDILYFYRKNPFSVSHGNKAEIRRLGVIARLAARIRRKSGKCPLDSGAFGTYPEFLTDSWFIENAELTAREKVIATSFPLAGTLPLVSVLIPYYNANEYFSACLQSLKNSQFRNFEICIFDDASTPPVDDLFGDELRSTSDFPLQIQRGGENRGAAYARNRCLEMAQGQFICFLDSDDLIHHDRIATQLEYLLAHSEVLGVGTGIYFVSQSGTLLRSETYPEQAVTNGGFHGCCATFMLKHTEIRHLRFDETLTTSSEDVDYLLRANAFGQLRNIADLLYSYRLRPDSLTSHPNWQADHASYMVNQVATTFGLSKIEDIIPFVSSLDGTQAGDLLLTAYWRRYRDCSEATFIVAKAFILMPKSATRLIKKKLELELYKKSQRLRSMLGRKKEGMIERLRRLRQLRSLSRILHDLKTKFNEPKDKIVRVYDNWGDAEEALDYLLPNSTRRWGAVRFITHDLPLRKPDYYLILNQPSPNGITLYHDPGRVIFAIGEPPTPQHKPFHKAQGEGTIVFSCDESVAADFGAERKYILEPCMTRTWSVKKSITDLISITNVQKTKKLSWITSNLALLPGHRKRLDFLKRIQGTVEFDLFGRGFKELHDKWVGLAPYEYSIAYENTISDYYFTEKLMDCFVAHTIPIYVGSPRIYQFFPEKSLIPIDPDDPRVAHRILDIINFDDLSARRQALEEAKLLVLTKYNMFIKLATHIAAPYPSQRERREIRIDPIKINWG
ncbi:glycosyltransferase [Methylococcus sp. EFPC2]|uniref:glycosyltransferase n=1 Tax=Methylococcus sp. EFPC2 TaxID=2812648 RepID=UPI001967A1B7|nr:glycosyltransferase [Methylococcus sp. EFPC2]QSA96817.1 glycosyltransferase [Methylococcus sp. EFPC2]